MTPEETLQRLLYRDGLILIIDKPAGIPVHAGPKGGENLEQYFPHLQFGLPRPPSLAHRLDRDTSGCLVLGRHRKALARLGKLFSSGRVEKTYWAIVEGAPQMQEGIIDLPLAKKSKDKRSWHMKVDKKDGQPSVTDYRVLAEKDGLCWLELKPRTGRTHQLRVHTAHLGFPIVGDSLYGNGKGMDSRLQLHARSITLPLYPNKDAIHCEAPPPEHMAVLLAEFGYKTT